MQCGHIYNMKTTVNFSEFCDSFSDTYKNNFSYEGKRALFDYLESYEEDTGEEIELDTVALCCEYSEYSSALDCIEECGYKGFEKDKDATEDENEALAMEWLQDQTQVIPFESDTWGTIKKGIIILDF